MAFDKDKIFQLPAEERRELAFKLLDSIDEEFINKPVPEWKKDLIHERINRDIANPGDTLPWAEVKNKYSDQ